MGGGGALRTVEGKQTGNEERASNAVIQGTFHPIIFRSNV
jgi:hypothetical protein